MSSYINHLKDPKLGFIFSTMAEESLNITEIWTQTISRIRGKVSDSDYSSWFSRLRFDGEKNGCVTLNVPSAFFRDGFESKYRALVESTLTEISGKPMTVKLVIKKETEGSRNSAAAPAAKEAADKAMQPRQVREKKTSSDCQLNPAYTFDSFVPGENSNFAYSAAMAIAKNPGSVYNPCLLYGGVGLGKTHLLQSIGNYIQQNSNIKIMYVTTENFTNDFIQSINDKTQSQFQKKYRKVSVLLMDDIQFLQKKEGIQSELFNTFNDLYDTGRQIVFTSDRPVEELRDISDRLRSRFERGLCIDIQPPDYETRIAILKAKCAEKNFTISSDVLEYIAKNISSNVRALESCITKLIAYSTLLNKDISLETAKEQLKQIINSNNDTSGITIDFIIRSTAAYFNVSPFDIKGKSRGQSIIIPRQIAMYLCRTLTDYSTNEIASEFGGKNHTTVIYYVQKVSSLIQAEDADTINTVTKLTNLIKQENKRN